MLGLADTYLLAPIRAIGLRAGDAYRRVFARGAGEVDALVVDVRAGAPAERSSVAEGGRREAGDQARAAWRRRAGELRSLVRQRRVVRDPCPGEIGSVLEHAERCLLRDRGYSFDTVSLYWIPPR